MAKEGFEWFERPDGSKNVKLAEGFRILTGKSEGRVIWKNVLRVDWVMLMLVISMVILAWSYSHDTKVCKEIVSDPCKALKNYTCRTSTTLLGELYFENENITDDFSRGLVFD